jgi:hypothetical protein
MACPRCGAKQGRDNLFCTKCGTRLISTSTLPSKNSMPPEEIDLSPSSKEEEKILRELKDALKMVENPQPPSTEQAASSTPLPMKKKVWIVGGSLGLIFLLALAFDLVQKTRKVAVAPPPLESALQPQPVPPMIDDATRTTLGKIAVIMEAISQYSQARKTLPSSLPSLNRAFSDPEAVQDGWGRNILYFVDLTNNTYIIRSLGADGKRETADDLLVSNDDAGSWLRENEQTILEWKTANPNLYSRLAIVSPAQEDLKKLEATRKADEEKRKQEAEALEQARKQQEEEQKRLEAARIEDDRQKQAEAKIRQHEEELREAKAREESAHRQQAIQQSIEFKDNFTDGLAQWDAPSSWEIVKDKELSALRVQGLGFLKKGANWDNYKMEFEIKVNKESAGWVVRAQNPSNFYLFKLGSDKAKSIPKNSLAKYIFSDGKYLNSLKREDAPGAAGVTPLPFKVKNKEFYNVVVVVRGNTITHYMDGIQVDSWVDNTFDQGRFGFNASIIEMATIRSISAGPAR